MSSADANAAYEAGIRGQTSATLGLLQRLDEGTYEGRAWRLVLEAQRSFADPTASPPSADSLLGIPAQGHPIIWRALVELERAALLELDSVGLASWLELHRALHCDRLGALWLQVYEGWLKLFEGGVPDIESLAALGTEARQLERPQLVVEIGVLRAFVALVGAEPEEGRKLARRASRMARTEGLPHAECLANVVLARLRRMDGFPHLSGRILFALSRFASPRFGTWISWELAMAGLAPEVATGPAQALLDAQAAARMGDRDGFESFAADVRAAVAGFDALSHEADLFLAASDPEAEHVPDALQAWAAGQSDTLPSGVLAAPDDNGARAYVYAQNGGVGRRVLTPGRGLASAAGAVVLPRMKRKQSRAETLAAVLALAGPEGLSTTDCFRLVYGFEFIPEIHKGTFDVLLHRARSYVEEAGELSRDGDRVSLRLHRAVLVPDPRCAEPTEMRLLRALAEAGAGSSARSVAKSTGVSLRMAQAALQALVEEGVCLVEREGRNVVYRVEDTTFMEPTAHR